MPQPSCQCSASFNPRPPLLAGESSPRRTPLRASRRFQSAPAIAGGRIPGGRSSGRTTCCFNPRPPLLAGESPTKGKGGHPQTFQSAPAIAGGRIPGQRQVSQHRGKVSIRARHCWRANRVQLGQQGAAHAVSIRARHCWRANRNRPASHQSTDTFQSAPAIAGGRIEVSCCPAPAPRGFNPRPPLLAGESRVFQRLKEAFIVSIRARHCWRANRIVWQQGLTRMLFQSAPAIAGGRINARLESLERTLLFQSAPAIAGGRIATPLSGPWASCSFNPRPPLLAGESRWRAQSRPPPPFQSAPAIAGGRIPDARLWPADWRVSIRARHCWRANPWERVTTSPI